MCVDNSGAYDPRNPATDRRLTMYWIGWVFFGITITSIFIAGVMVSMYKMNIQDSKARSNDEGYDNPSHDGDYDDASKDGAGEEEDVGTRRLQPTRRPGRRQPAAPPNRGLPRPRPGGTLSYNVTTTRQQPPQPNDHEDATPDHYDHPSTLVIDDAVPTNRSNGS